MANRNKQQMQHIANHKTIAFLAEDEDKNFRNCGKKLVIQ